MLRSYRDQKPRPQRGLESAASWHIGVLPSIRRDQRRVYLSGVQPIQPAGSLQSIVSLTLDLHQNLALRGSLSIVTETHRVITQATARSLALIERSVRAGVERAFRAAEPILVKAAKGELAYSRGLQVLAKREDYIGGKKESWTKFEAPGIENFHPIPLDVWGDPFADDVIRAAIAALSREPGPGRDRSNFKRSVHYSSEGEPDTSPFHQDGEKKSPGSTKAGWLFYYGSDFTRAGGLR